jgi:integrase
MNTTSVRIKLRKSFVDGKEGTLYYQVIHNRMVRQIATDYHLRQAEWHEDDENIVLSKGINAECNTHLRELAERIRSDRLRFARIISELDSNGIVYTADDVVAKYNALTSRQSLQIYMQSIIKQQKAQGHIRTSETYTATLKSFMVFREGKDISWDCITPTEVKSYEVWLKAKGVSLNTVSFYMRILRAVYNRAVNEGLTTDQHPFNQVYTSVAKTAKRGISTTDIAKIMKLELSASPSRAFARDIFMFSFYTRGMSLIDIAKLKTDNLKNGVLTYQRSKTSQRISVKWRDEMQVIVDHHHQQGSDRLLPIIKNEADIRKQYDTALHKINYNLKKIGEAIGLSIPLTMYVARHSWASAASQNNIPLHVISQCLGHDSEHTTQIYLSSIDVNQMDEANEKIIRKLKGNV